MMGNCNIIHLQWEKKKCVGFALLKVRLKITVAPGFGPVLHKRCIFFIFTACEPSNYR